MMYTYVLTHQSNLVSLYALGCWVICMLLADPFPQGRLLVVVLKHIMWATRGRLIRTQCCEVPLVGHLTLPKIRPLTLSRKWHLALPRCQALALPRCQALALFRSRHFVSPPVADICLSPSCDGGNLSSCVSLSNPHGTGIENGYGMYDILAQNGLIPS
jgi:hypothetical protein